MNKTRHNLEVGDIFAIDYAGDALTCTVIAKSPTDSGVSYLCDTVWYSSSCAHKQKKIISSDDYKMRNVLVYLGTDKKVVQAAQKNDVKLTVTKTEEIEPGKPGRKITITETISDEPKKSWWKRLFS